jgi:hypothetical protein
MAIVSGKTISSLTQVSKVPSGALVPIVDLTKPFNLANEAVTFGNLSGQIVQSISSNTSPNLVYATGDQTISGIKTFNSGIYTSGINVTGGNLGIGTSTPNYRLDISGNIGNSQGDFVIYSCNSAYNFPNIFKITNDLNNTSLLIDVNNSLYKMGDINGLVNDTSFIIDDGNSKILFLGGEPYFGVGINTTTPNHTLDVNGDLGLIGFINGGYLGSNFIGTNAGNGATSAYYSNFLGQDAGNNATNAYYSNFLGQSAGYSAINAECSNFFGLDAGNGATNAYYSNFFGLNAGQSAVSAYNSNFFGRFAGYSATRANNSNFFGYYAGNNATNASNSIFIGFNAGYHDNVNNTGNGESSILIGDYTNTSGFSNSIAIGRGTANSATGQLNLGNVIFANGLKAPSAPSNNAITTAKVGIATDTPAYTLDVNGSGNFAQGISISSGYGIKLYDAGLGKYVTITCNNGILSVS